MRTVIRYVGFIVLIAAAEDRDRITALADDLLDTALDLADDATAFSWTK